MSLSSLSLRVIHLGWERRTYDVSTAYLQADATSDEDRIPLIYPRGMARYDYRGNELRGVLISNLYGHPFVNRALSSLWSSSCRGPLG